MSKSNLDPSVTGITLDPSGAKNRQEIYSSLTDLNNIPLFTDVYENYKKEIGKEEETLKNQRMRMVFGDNEIKTSKQEDWIKEQIFTETRTQALSKQEKSGNSDFGFIEISMLFLAVLGVCTWYRVSILKKKATQKQNKSEVKE